MPETITQVKQDLVKWFGEKITGSKFFDDYARIGSYLSDPSQYRNGLDQLEATLEQKVDQRVPPLLYPNWRRGFMHLLAQTYRKLGSQRETVNRTGYTLEALALGAFHKVLTDALKENEIQNGFQVGAHDNKIDILIGFPEGSEFNDFLRARQLFKDLSAGKEHGENSHRIQWYLVTKMGTLTNPVTEIYSKLPGWRTPEPIGPRRFYIWEFLVDRDGVPSNAVSIPFKTTDQSDFRAPSNLNRWLSDGRLPQYRLLWSILAERWQRRDGYMMDQYLAKKMDPRKWSDLSLEAQNIFRDEVLPGGSLRILKR
jgi:hypothetical protein